MLTRGNPHLQACDFSLSIPVAGILSTRNRGLCNGCTKEVLRIVGLSDDEEIMDGKIPQQRKGHFFTLARVAL